MPSPEEVGTRWFTEVWNQRNRAVIPDLMHPDSCGHLEGGQELIGPEQFVAFQDAILAVMPDIQVEILNLVAGTNDACVLWKATGKHTGEGMGFKPTGKTITFRGTTWLHIKKGKIAEGWDCWDYGSLMAALASPPVV